MAKGFFFMHGSADLSLALELAERGYLVVPLTPQAERDLTGEPFEGRTLPDKAIHAAIGESHEDAERMAEEMLSALRARAPEVVNYEGLDLGPSLFHGIYHYLAVEVAFARRVATHVAEGINNGTKVAVGEDGHLSPLVDRLMNEFGIEILHVKPAGKGKPGSIVATKGGSMRTLLRDAPLLAKKAPRPPASDKRRVALVATAPTHLSLSLDVLEPLSREFALELYGAGFDPTPPEGLLPLRAGRLDSFSIRTSSTMRRRARHYRSGLRAIEPVRRSLSLEHWRWSDSLIESRLPVIIDRATYYAEQCLTFARSRPDLVLMMDEKSLLSRLVPGACALNAVPTLDLQHGMLASDASMNYVEFTKFAVFGQATLEVLVDRGVRPESVEVTGCPRFDALAASRRAPRDEVLARFGLDRDLPLVLAATQPMKYTITSAAKRAFIGALVSATEGGSFQLLVKKHPYEKDGIVEDLTASAKHVAVTADGPLADLVAASHVVTTIHSTVALEALILGRPVVVFQPEGMLSTLPYCTEEAAEVAADGEALAGALAAVIGPERQAAQAKRQAFLARHIRLDGHAADRIAALARELVEARRD